MCFKEELYYLKVGGGWKREKNITKRNEKGIINQFRQWRIKLLKSVERTFFSFSFFFIVGYISNYNIIVQKTFQNPIQ